MQSFRLRGTRKGIIWHTDLAFYYDEQGVDRYECRAVYPYQFSIMNMATGQSIETPEKTSPQSTEEGIHGRIIDPFNGLNIPSELTFERDSREFFRIRSGADFGRDEILFAENVFPLKYTGVVSSTISIPEYFHFKIYSLADCELTMLVSDNAWCWIALAAMYKKWVYMNEKP